MDPSTIPAAISAENRAFVPITVTVAVLSVAAIMVSLRVYTRAVVLNQFGKDDAAAVIALLLAIGCGTAVAGNTRYGLGRHIWTLDGEEVTLYFRCFYVSIVFYNAAMTAVKATFLLQYYRVLETPRMRKVITLALCLIGSWQVSWVFIAVASCVPIEKFWLPQTPGGCIDQVVSWYIQAGANIITDITIFVLPMPVFWHLKLRKTQRILLIGIFSLGFFTSIISIFRIQFIHLSSDVTWDNVAPACWSIGELCSGITCACLPTLRPIMGCIPGLGSGTSKGSRGYHHKSYGHDLTDTRISRTTEFETTSSYARGNDLEARLSTHASRASPVNEERLKHFENVDRGVNPAEHHPASESRPGYSCDAWTDRQ